MPPAGMMFVSNDTVNYENTSNIIKSHNSPIMALDIISLQKALEQLFPY